MNRKERRAEKKSGAAPKGASAAVAGLLAEAVQHHQNGRLNDAERLYRDVLHADARNADALHLLGVLSHQAGHHESAADLIGKAIAQNGHVPAFHWSLGNALAGQDKFDQAAASYRRALALKPDYAEVHKCLGNVLQKQGKPAEAAGSYRQALECRPAYVEATLALGVCLQDLGNTDEAEAAYRQALSMKPDLLEAHNNLGNILQQHGRFDEAIASYRRVLALKPDFAEVQNNLGTALREQGKVDEAIAAYKQAIATKPHLAEPYSNLLMTLHYVTNISNEALLAAASEFGKTFDRATGQSTPLRAAVSSHRLRIGYVSGDLFYHPVGYFLARVLAVHDKARFEIFCYSNATTVDAMTERLRASCNHWSSIAGLSDQAATTMIEKDNIDILIDLSGHTARNRLPLFALRPAPVQVCWLGYFGTTGLPAIDYIVMDAATVPEGEERWYSEAVVRLPFSRFCYDAPETEAPSDPPSLRNGFITFGSFNNIAKINASVVSLWAQVLQAVPKSKLVLKWKALGEHTCRQRLIESFSNAGVAADRLELRGASSHRQMLTEYGDIDIALDPFPFCGGLTSCEALWMGVPVITWPGETPASRQTMSFLHLLQLGDFAAASAEDYVARAAALAADHERLRALRHALRPKMSASPLCDGPRFTKGFEAALLRMWARHLDGLPSQPFDIAASVDEFGSQSTQC